VRLRDWRPVCPEGELRSISLHWTAHDYDAVFPAYHFCLRGVSDIVVAQTHDLRANMRDLRRDPSGPYAAHTLGRNSWSIGIAVCGMAGARPSDFGRYPLSTPQIDALCLVARRLADAYGIPLGAIRTHAEAALEDEYFGADDDELRWDIARLEARPEPLEEREAQLTGELLRARIAAVP
jgi:N-acetylmuramoyl-L-alanine amidase-like protein